MDSLSSGVIFAAHYNGASLLLYNPIISFTMRSQPLMAPTSTSRLNANSPTYVHTAVTTDALVSTAGGLDEIAEKMMPENISTNLIKGTTPDGDVCRICEGT